MNNSTKCVVIPVRVLSILFLTRMFSNILSGKDTDFTTYRTAVSLTSRIVFSALHIMFC